MKPITEYIQKKHVTQVSLNRHEIEEQFKELIDKYSGTKLQDFCQARYYSYAKCRPENIKQDNKHSFFDVHVTKEMYQDLERTDLYMMVFNYGMFFTNILKNTKQEKKRVQGILNIANKLHDKDFVTCAVSMYGGIIESDEPLVVFKSIDELDTILKIIEKAL